MTSQTLPAPKIKISASVPAYLESTVAWISPIGQLGNSKDQQGHADSKELPDPVKIKALQSHAHTNEPKEHKTSATLAAISQGQTLLGPPLFNDHEKQRHHILTHMAGAFRVSARDGYAEGMSGQMSVRDPENPHTFWTNPLGRHFGLMTASDLVLVDYAGKAVGGNTSRPANAAGFLIHSALHQARPDVHAVCHAHSISGKAWSAFARPLEMINQDVCIFYGEAQGVYGEFGGIVFSEDEGKRLSAALGPKGKGLILRNHGLLTVGGTIDEAAYLFGLMERSCRIQLMVEAAAANGVPKVFVGDKEAEYTFRMTSDSDSLYCEFQPDLDYEEALCNGAFKA